MKSLRILNGYRVVYCPEHPKSMKSDNWDGYIYEHIKIAEEYLGRPLSSDEVVHHLDEDRSNNRTENLLILLRSEHMKLHSWMKSCVTNGKPLDDNRMNSKKSKATTCEECGISLQNKQTKYCSLECRDVGTSRKSKIPSKSELEELLDAKTSYLALGRRYGVCDNAVRKWARKYGLLTTTLSQASSTLDEGAETTGEVEAIPKPS